jgi:ubiquinol-cytochrome c reductase cytochrome b subunit
MAQPDTTDTTSEVHSYRARVAEHGRFRAVMESFAYLPPFGAMFKKTSPFYAESYWYCMGGITFLMFLYLTISGVLLTWLGPFWWLTNPVGKAMKGTHYWAAQAFFFFLVLHLIRVWATGAFRGRRWLSWALGSAVLLLSLGENLFGLLARGDWESQFVSMHSDDMLFTQPFFFHLFSPANFTADLAIHVAVIPVVLFALIMGHLTLVRLQGIARPL